MTEAVIALGANLGEPKKALEQALKRISKIEQTILLKVSSFYRVEAIEKFTNQKFKVIDMSPLCQFPGLPHQHRAHDGL